MLNQRSKLQLELSEIEKERAKLAVNEQKTILNTGKIRAPIKLKFNN